MYRRLTKAVFGLVLIGMVAATVQGCAERRYSPTPQPAVARASVAQAETPAPAESQTARPAATQPATAKAPAPAAPASETAAPPAKTAAPSAPKAAETAADEATAKADDAANTAEAAKAEEPVRTEDGKVRIRASSATEEDKEVPLIDIDEVPDEVARRLEEYRLGPGDRLQIKVFGQDDISGEFEVSAAGELSYPLIGQITAENQTPGEFNQVLTKALEEFFVNPQVTVEVTNYRPFFILGQVGKPGSYKYQPGLNARQAIAVGGGYTRRAREEPITIYRTNNAGELIKFEAGQDAIILPGDTIEVHRRLF